MPAVQIVSSKPLAGKSTLAAGIARGFAEDGARVRLERVGAGEAAAQDAKTFATLRFASSGGRASTQAPRAADGETLIVELDAGAEALAVTPALIAVHRTPDEADVALAKSLGNRLVGSIAVAVDPAAVEAVARELTDGGLRPLAILPEDLTLAAPSVGEIGAALNAKVLYDGDNAGEVVQDIVIAPVYADPARPHFHRFDSKAILAPFNKTDLHLAALEAGAACLVITGGRDPSPYVIDRAQHEPTTILLSSRDTPGTVNALADVWTASRFRGERKAEAAYACLKSRLDFASLARKLNA